jgi:hypothetical protein
MDVGSPDIIRRANYMTKLEGFTTATRVLATERLSLGDAKVDKQRKAAIDEQLADIAEEAGDYQALLKNIDFLIRATASEQQQKPQEHQQRPHSSLNISGAGVRSLPCTTPAPLNPAMGGKQQQQQQQQQQQVDDSQAKTAGHKAMKALSAHTRPLTPTKETQERFSPVNREKIK